MVTRNKYSEVIIILFNLKRKKILNMTNTNKCWNGNFLLIVLGNFVSRMGTIIFDIALSWWLVDVTGSARYIGYILAASLLPVAVLSPISGVFSDRWNKKYILIISDFLSGIFSICVSIMAFLNMMNIPLLILFSFLLGTCSSLFKPTIKSIIPRLVDKSSLIKANSIFATISHTTKMVGPLAGGALIALPSIGVPGTLAFNGLSFIFSAISEIFIKYKAKQSSSKKSKIISSLKQGFGYVNSNKIIKNLLIVASLSNIFLASLVILLPLYIKLILKEPVRFYSFTLAAGAIGGIIISILFIIAKNIKPTLKLITLTITLTGIMLSLASLSPIFKPLLLIFIFLIGLLSTAFNTLYYSYVQAIVDKDLQGRVFSIIYMIATISIPVSYLVFGFLGDYILKLVFFYSGIGIILCSLPLFFIKNLANEINSLSANSNF